MTPLQGGFVSVPDMRRVKTLRYFFRPFRAVDIGPGPVPDHARHAAEHRDDQERRRGAGERPEHRLAGDGRGDDRGGPGERADRLQRRLRFRVGL